MTSPRKEDEPAAGEGSSTPEPTTTAAGEEGCVAMDVETSAADGEEKAGGDQSGDNGDKGENEGKEKEVDAAASGMASMVINGVGKAPITTGATTSATLAEEGKGSELQAEEIASGASTDAAADTMVLLPPNPAEGEMLLVGSKQGIYHCDYCMKDISTTVRIKCAECKDFDLCVDCFCVGVELTPHKNYHAYRVVDNTSFPVFASDWTATEELAMLAGE